ncbi:hypothetical protein A3840_03780 [Devosia elaeis]|uniref:Uncharacterized protein n=1 Tax=Devosia elaeis TaxID=1770058 RepID=A0A178I2T0_9HYPH|nr:hypothetical protein A3840_03780 [Devosia elaeis]
MALLLAPGQMLHAAHRGMRPGRLRCGDWLVDEKTLSAAPNTIFRMAQIGGGSIASLPLEGRAGVGVLEVQRTRMVVAIADRPEPPPSFPPLKGEGGASPKPIARTGWTSRANCI